MLEIITLPAAELVPYRNNPKEHPTMKPMPLIAYLIQNSSKEGYSVFDPFGGSGSTLIACEQTRRVCYMSEIEPKYCDVAVKRYIKQAGSSDGIFVGRGGERLSCAEAVSAVSAARGGEAIESTGQGDSGGRADEGGETGAGAAAVASG